eukprot:TRINITY_DN15784_c0_g1_i1.p1 TRINITY_DN15784_c0_g1~~TRINITY_DN15784_c0_g1_i1.p1  ORF type:complete len:588 (+),score=79.71 TRINITY_DN15784_c0_g1_i1:61-1824(+)
MDKTKTVDQVGLITSKDLTEITSLFEKDNVVVSPSGMAKDKRVIPGVLSLLRQDSTGECFLRWTSYKYRAEKEKQTNLATRISDFDSYELKIPIKELRSIKKYVPSIGGGTPYIIVQTNSGVAFPPFYFNEGGVKEFLRNFKEHVNLEKSPLDHNLLYLNDLTDPLTRSKNALDVAISFGGQYTNVTSADNYLRDFSMKLLSTFSQVPKIGRRAVNVVMGNGGMNEIGYPENTTNRNSKSVSSTLGNFELLGESRLEGGSFTLPTSERSKPVSPSEWCVSFDSTGNLEATHNYLLQRIFSGGADPSIRAEVWKFLLRYYPWNSTLEERNKIRSAKALEYALYKKQWTSITPEQESHHSKFRHRKQQIEKDVWRTDREHPFFKDKRGVGLQRLSDILTTYCTFNFDLGYAQGMNDLLAPILILMEDEVDTFWCFKGLMDEMAGNFDKDQIGLHKQFIELERLLNIFDPQLHAYLKSADSLNMYFCFRWLLINFKREFSLPDIQVLWEVCWSLQSSRKFHLFIALSILLSQRETILSQNMNFDDLLRLMNDLAGKIDLDKTLQIAQSLYRNFENLDNDVKSNVTDVKPK